MANIDKVSVKNTVYNIVSPAVVSDYIEVIGGACTKPDGYVEDEVILAKQNDVQLLFKATQTIAFGANIVENTNCVRTTLEEVLKNAGGGGGASSADQVSYDNSDSGLEAENVQEAVDELATNAGTASSQIQTLTNQANDMVNVLGAKNLAEIILEPGTRAGVTFAIDNDGIFSVSGTTTGELLETICTFTGLSKIKASTNMLGGSGTTYDIILYDITTSYWLSPAIGTTISEAEFTLNPQHNYRAVLVIRNAQSVTLNNIYFMIRPASIEDDTYEPYAMTNQELTEDVKNIKLKSDSVSVYGDGTKTIATLMAELHEAFKAVPNRKVTNILRLWVQGFTTVFGGFGEYDTLSSLGFLRFTDSILSSNELFLLSAQMGQYSGQCFLYKVKLSDGTITDLSTEVVANGSVVRIVYNYYDV